MSCVLEDLRLYILRFRLFFPFQGPSGLVDGGISARNHAANIANDEINQVKQELQLKKQKVLESEEDLILAKA